MRDKILAAMSGGVDSAAAALILKKRNIYCEGATMRLFVAGEDEAFEGERDAAAVCSALGMDFSVFDMRDEFRCRVINEFIEAYIRGETPNPCIICNKEIKFGLFLERALAEGFSKIATGHYAKVSREGGRYLVMRGKSREKDQSYMLWSLSQEQLSHVILPLGDMTKDEVRALAESENLPVANKSESQDICFVPDGDYAGFIRRVTGRDFPAGDFTDTEGNILGRHKGLIHYTVGQRRGLGLSLKAPLYVREKDAKSNRVVLCPDEGLFSKYVRCCSANWIACESPADGMRVEAKIRYRHEAAPAVLHITGEDSFVLEFDGGQRAATPGQSCVVYCGDTVLGGGIIDPMEK